MGPWLSWRWIWIVFSVMQHSVQWAETLGRTRTMYIGIRTRALWPWWTQHLWQQGSEWWKWWMLWDCGFLLGSEVHCAAESEASTVCGLGGGDILKGPPMWDQNVLTTYSGRVGQLCKQFGQTNGELLAAWLLWLWDTGVDPVPVEVLQVFTERSRGTACEMLFWKCEDPKGGLSW